MRDTPFQFDFAISFAGEDRAVAEEVARRLRAAGASVFYDRFYRSWLLGKSFGSVVPAVYTRNTRFFVPIVSEHYGRKHFPLREFLAAKEEQSRRAHEYVLPLRLDDAALPGLDPEVLYIDLRNVTVEHAVADMLQKLRETEANPWRSPGEWVATFGLLIDDLLENWRLPENVSTYYPILCDWLEHDLQVRLRTAGLKNLYQPEASARDGECLSVRFAFTIEGDPTALDFGDLGWWELLELAPLCTIYPEA